MNMLRLFALICTLLPFWVSAQNPRNFKIVRQGSGEPIAGVRVISPDAQVWVSDERGYVHIGKIPDSLVLTIYHPGYVVSSFKPESEGSSVITLFPTQAIDAGIYQHGSLYANWLSERINTAPFQTKAAHKQPALLCEDDLLRTQLLLPGVSKGYDGQTLLIVRGGNAEQTLFSVDDIPLYQAHHLFGYISWYSPEWYQSAQFHPGLNPVSSGGRASGFFNAQLKDGFRNEWTGGSALNILSVSGWTAGPLGKNAGLMIYGRRSYLDLLIAPLLASQGGDGTESLGLYFFDIGGKLSFKIGKRKELHIGALRGGDVLDFTVSELLDSQPNIRRTLSQRVAQISGTTYARFIENAKEGSEEYKLYYSYQRSINQFDIIERNLLTNVEELNATQSTRRRVQTIGAEWKKVRNSQGPGKYEFGIHAQFHQINTGDNRLRVSGTNFTNIDSSFALYPQNPALELAVFYGNNRNVNKDTRIFYGGRISGLLGEDFLPGIEPRLWVYHKLNPIWDLHAGYTVNRQYIHYTRQSRFPGVMDYWVMADKDLKPQTTQHMEVGVSRFLKKKFQLNVTGYFRLMNLTEFQPAYFAEFIYGNWKESLLWGKGRAGGIEFLLKKNSGLTNGWISYTFSLSNRTMEALNGGEAYPFLFQRLHDFTLFAQNKVGKRAWLVLTLNYASGAPYSLANAKYILPSNPNLLNSWNSQTVITYSNKNSFRLPSYFRIDVGYRIDSKNNGLWKDQSFNLTLYNLTSYQNPYSIYLDRNSFGKYKATQFSLFPFIPSISYSFRF